MLTVALNQHSECPFFFSCSQLITTRAPTNEQSQLDADIQSEVELSTPSSYPSFTEALLASKSSHNYNHPLTSAHGSCCTPSIAVQGVPGAARLALHGTAARRHTLAVRAPHQIHTRLQTKCIACSSQYTQFTTIVTCVALVRIWLLSQTVAGQPITMSLQAPHFLLLASPLPGT